MSERSIDEIIADLDKVQLEDLEVNTYEVDINNKIAKLRTQLYDLQQRRRENRVKRTALEKEKASAERVAALKAEQEKIDAELEITRQRAEEFLAAAPWIDSIYPWQKEGAIKLAAAKRALLADVRGMGKTLSSLAWRRAVGGGRTLVLTRRQYAREFLKEVHYWEPDTNVLPLISADASMRQLVVDVIKQHKDIICVANFEMWRRRDDAIEDLLRAGFDNIILDEAHQLKTFESATTRGFRKLAPAVPYLLEMTGTPVQNRPPELFAILHTLHPNLFPDENKFKFDYCERIDQNRWGWRPGGLETLMNKMSRFFIARTPESVGHTVPPPAIHNYELDFSGYPEQHEAYRTVADRGLAVLKEKILPLPGILAIMTRLAQINAWPGDLELKDKETGEVLRFDIHQSVKMDWAEDLIKELVDEGQRVVLFSRFKSPIYELARRLRTEMSVATVTGDNKLEHDDVIYDFDLKTAPENPKYQTLLATYDTIGESVNLNAARHLIQFDRYWKPSRDDQAIGRIDRINSLDQATVHRAVVATSIDEYMIELIEWKRAIINEFADAKDIQTGLIEHLERVV